MMETLIINKRRELPKTKRLIWDSVTVLLWIGFIYLWKPVLVIFYQIITSEVPPEEISGWIYDNIHSVTFEHAVWMLSVTPIVLFILSRLSRHQAPSEHLIYSQSDYSNHFNVDALQLQACSDSQLVNVYHDEYGHITALENQIMNNGSI